LYHHATSFPCFSAVKMRSLQVLFLFGCLIALAAADCSKKQEKQLGATEFDRTMSWSVDGQFSAASAGAEGTYQGFQEVAGLTLEEIEQLRQAAVQWTADTFGVNTTGAFLDPTSLTTILPNWGVIIALYVNLPYLLLSSHPKIDGCPYLTVSEFVAFPNSALSLTYGGTYGAWAAAHGSSTLNVLPTDRLSYGLYTIVGEKPEGHNRQPHNILFKNIYPARSDPDQWGSEHSTLHDLTGQLGDGESHIVSRVGYFDNFSQVAVKFRNTWNFPFGTDFPAS